MTTENTKITPKTSGDPNERLEFVVSVNDPTVWDTGFWDEMTKDGLGDNYVPKRAVDVANERPFNDRCAHFLLTPQEALDLKNDSRVKNVELKADLQDDVEKILVAQRPGIFDKSNNTTAGMLNWGLLRSTKATNPFSSTSTVASTFDYTLDGTGVDIIIMDSGVEPNHPEFAVNADGTGGSRVVDFNWHSLGVPGTPTSAQIGGYLGDSDGHGSHVASTAAGNTCGWAPGASIYSLRIFSGTDISGSNLLGAIDSDIAFDIVRAFHLAKIAAGNTRPTIVNNSWGYRSTYSGMTSTRYRGTVYSNTSPNANYGQVFYLHPYVLDYITDSVENCADAGVILIGAAGNYRHKIDVPGGLDYDNYYVYSGSFGTENVYYHRGSSPTNAPSMICVGSVDNTITEQKADYSETGPRVDVFAPGSMVMGAYANSFYQTAAVSDPRNNSYYLNKLSGTSMASPQVTGMLACLLESRPDLTTAQAKQFIDHWSVKNALVGGASTAYNNFRGLQGAANQILKTPFNTPVRGGFNLDAE